MRTANAISVSDARVQRKSPVSAPSYAPRFQFPPLGKNESAPRGESKHQGGDSASVRARRKQAQLNASLPCEIVESLRYFAKSSNRAIADILEQAIGEFLARSMAGQSAPRGVSEMTDDAAENSTHSIISRQCQEIAGVTYSAADRAAVDAFVAEHGSPAESHVRAGIAATLIRTKHPRIHSVSYFLPEILRAMEAGADAGYADHCVRRLQRERQIRASSGHSAPLSSRIE
jgi:hypothetical protein